MKTYQLPGGQITLGNVLIEVEARSLKEARQNVRHRRNIKNVIWDEGQLIDIKLLEQPSEAEKAAGTNSD